MRRPFFLWRRHPDSDRRIADLQSAALPLGYGAEYKICGLLSARKSIFGAGNEARTRYLHLGKVALYRMSYARVSVCYFTTKYGLVKCFRAQLPKAGKAGRIPKLRPRYLHRQGK